MKKRVRRELTQIEKDKILADYKNGVKIVDIAKEINRDWNTVKGVLKRSDLYKITQERISEDIKNQALQLYLIQNKSARQICKKLKISKFTVLQILHKNNVDIDYKRNIKLYDFNENYFERIDSEDKAYFLGFLYADGYNNQKEGRVTLSLADQDLNVLEKFNECLNSNKPIYNKQRTNGKGMNIVELSFNSRKFSDDLAKLGCVQAKTFKLKFPTSDQVPEHLHRHFIRGYFDGDGYISKKQNRFEIVGTLEFCEELIEIFYQNLKINPSKIRIRHPERNHNIRILIYYGLNNIYTTYPFLYNDANIYLERKKDKFSKLYNNIKETKERKTK